tara:strand:- start:1104 stop:1337 length:234 start_codon:yes stop_codon:yes gene_type:complete
LGLLTAALLGLRLTWSWARPPIGAHYLDHLLIVTPKAQFSGEETVHDQDVAEDAGVDAFCAAIGSEHEEGRHRGLLD